MDDIKNLKHNIFGGKAEFVFKNKTENFTECSDGTH